MNMRGYAHHTRSGRHWRLFQKTGTKLVIVFMCEMDSFYEELSLAKKIFCQNLGNVQIIVHLLDPIQTINNGQSGELNAKNHSLSKSYKYCK